MKEIAIHANKNSLSTMNKIISAFIGWVTSLCVLAKIQIPFINWFTNIHTSDAILLIVSAVKGVFVAILNWYVVEQVSSRYKKWKIKNKLKK